MRASKVSFRTPDNGSIVVERPTHGVLERALTDAHAARDIQNIGLAAYEASQWVQDIAAQNSMDSMDLALRVKAFNTGGLPRQIKRIEASGKHRKKVEYWFGEHIEPRPDPISADSTSFDYMPQGWPHGFAKVEQQGGRDNPLLRAGQYLSRVGLYVCLHDLNVMPEKQGKGLGTAIAYTALRDQPKHLKSSLHTAANNEPMRAFAAKYGYIETDEYMDTDLFNGISAPFVRYEANSVHNVLRRMEVTNPWLGSAEGESTFWRMLDEQDAEQLSLYAH